MGISKSLTTLFALLIVILGNSNMMASALSVRSGRLYSISDSFLIRSGSKSDLLIYFKQVGSPIIMPIPESSIQVMTTNSTQLFFGLGGTFYMVD